MIAVAGKNVVVTGTVPGESRITAQAKLREAGAYVHDTVNGTTDVLVTGAKVGPAKIAKAEKLGVQVVPWEQIAWVGNPDDDGNVEDISYKLTPQRAQPRQIAPMLAMKADAPPVGAQWSYEVKWDGVRCIATVKDGAVAMQSRSAKSDYVATWPGVAAELAGMGDCVLDGELVVHEGGKQEYIVFDIIECDGNDLRQHPLTERRTTLRNVLFSEAAQEHVTHNPVHDDGEKLMAFCVEHGLEGLVAKRNDSRYLDGARDAAWMKVKVRPAQEFVVVGYTTGEGRRSDTFGALLLGVYDDEGRLMYCGKVGTGWDDAENRRLFAELEWRHVADDERAPGVVFQKKLPRAEMDGAVWVVPDLVVQCEFQRWTPDWRLWHPSYTGQRHDKSAPDVRREA